MELTSEQYWDTVTTQDLIKQEDIDGLIYKYTSGIISRNELLQIARDNFPKDVYMYISAEFPSTKGYYDAESSGLIMIQSCQIMFNKNITFRDLENINETRILVTGQHTPEENGVYNFDDQWVKEESEECSCAFIEKDQTTWIYVRANTWVQFAARARM